MAIIVSQNDSVFDVLSKLQNNGFEINAISFIKSNGYFGIKIVRDNHFVKIINSYSELMIISNFGNVVFAEKVTILDDLSCEELK